MEDQIVHIPERNRFEIVIGENTAYVKYMIHRDSLDIKHTIVPKALEGQGFAGRLVKSAYDYALANNLKPAATCPYAVAWLKRHPEYSGK